MRLEFPALAWVFFGAMCAAAAAPPDGHPVPHVSFDGPSLAFDFPAVKIGVAEYEEGPTGATVIVFSKKVLAAVDVRGELQERSTRMYCGWGSTHPSSPRSRSRAARPMAWRSQPASPTRSRSELRIPATGKTSRWCRGRSSSISADGAITP